jgi:hypothetical protein
MENIHLEKGKRIFGNFLNVFKGGKRKFKKGDKEWISAEGSQM